jgi:hypothetical protein
MGAFDPSLEAEKMIVEDIEALFEPTGLLNAHSMLTFGLVGPKKKQEKMSLGDFLGDQCERIFPCCRLFSPTFFRTAHILLEVEQGIHKRWVGLMRTP